MEEIRPGTPQRRSTRKVLLLVALFALGAALAYFIGFSSGSSEQVALLVKSNKLIGRDAAGIRELLPKVVFEGDTTNALTVCRVPGMFGDTYFQVTFKDGKVIGARTMSGPGGPGVPGE